MKVILRLADLDREAAALLSLLQRELSPSIDDSRLNWLYRLCPHGEAKVWVAAEEGSGRLVGAAAVFPRKMTFGSRVSSGFVFGDFCVSGEHRSLGLAVRLQRKCFETVDQSSFFLGYDLPSNAMLAVYRRLGRQPAGNLVRMVKMLRAGNWMAARVKSKTLAKMLEPAANALLKLHRGSLQMSSGVDVDLQNERFGEEFTELTGSVGAGLGLCVERSAEYLNWRYLDHPQQKYEILTARRDGSLQGYLVFRREGRSAIIVDWFGKEPGELRKDMMRGLISLITPEGCEVAQACVLESHPYYEDLRSLGFRPRESSPVMFFGIKQPSAGETHGDWLLMDGDRES